MPSVVYAEPQPQWVATNDPALPWRVQTSQYTAEMADYLDAGATLGGMLWRFTHRSGRITQFAPEAFAYIDHLLRFDPFWSLDRIQAAVAGDTITYDHPQYRVTYQALRDRLKLTMLLKVPCRAPNPDLVTEATAFLTLTGGIELPTDLEVWDRTGKRVGDFSTRGEVYLKDASGNVIQFLDRVTARDSEGHPGAGEIRLATDADGTRRLYQGMAWGWLQVAAFQSTEAFPEGGVEIDPTVVAPSTTNVLTRRIATLSTGRQVGLAAVTGGQACYVSDDNGLTWQRCTSPANGIVTTSTNSVAADRDADDVIHLLVTSGTTAAPGILAHVRITLSGLAATVTQTTVEPAQPVNLNWIAPELLVSGAAGATKTLYMAYVQGASTATAATRLFFRAATLTTAGVYTSTWSQLVTTTVTTGQGTRLGLAAALSRRADGTVSAIASADYYDAGKSWIGTFKNLGGGSYVANPNVMTDNPPVKFQGVDGFATGLFIANDAFNSANATGLWVYDDTDSIVKATITNASVNLNTAGRGAAAVGDPAKDRVLVIGSEPTTNYLHRFQYNVTAKTTQDSVTVDTTKAVSGSVTAPRSWNGSRLPVIFSDGSGLYSHTINYNTAPTMPTGLTRTNYDAADAATYAWQHNDPDGNAQASRQVQIVRVDTGAVAYDSGKVATAVQSFTLAGNTPGMVNNKQYQWRVMSWDTVDAASPWSSYVTFWCSGKPTAAITSPATDGATVVGGALTAQGTVSDPESEGGSAWQFVLTTNADAPLWDGLKQTTTSPPMQTVGYTTWTNGGSYKLKLTVWDAKGVASPQVVRTFTVSFTPPADPANLTRTPRPGRASNFLSWAPPAAPSGTESGNYRVERKWVTDPDSAYSILAAALTATSFEDMAAASGQSYTYRVSSVGTNGVLSTGATITGAVTFPVPWLIHPTDSSQNLTLPLTAKELVIQSPQTITDVEPLGATRKSRSTGNVLGAEGELTIICSHQNPRTYNLAQKLKAAKELANTWLLKLPQSPGPLMASIPGEVFEVSLGGSRIVKSPSQTVVTLPFLEVGDPVG